MDQNSTYLSSSEEETKLLAENDTLMDSYTNLDVKQPKISKQIKTKLILTILLIIVIFCGFYGRQSHQVFDFSSSKILHILQDNDLVVNVTDTPYWEYKNMTCTHDLFRKYYQTYGYFPGGRQWHDLDSKGVQSLYEPDICKLKYVRMPPTKLRKCFTKANLSSIVTIGDSNAQRYFFAFVHYMKTFAEKCNGKGSEKLKLGGYLPDKNYFTKVDENLEQLLNIHYRFCSGCGAKQKVCRWQKSTESENEAEFNSTSGVLPTYDSKLSMTTIEHLPLTMVLESSLRTLVPFEMYRNKNTTFMISKYFAESSAEFFFKLYLKNSYPDLLVIFLPFNHVKGMGKMDRWAAEIQLFHTLVKIYIPQSTTVFYMPTFREFEHAKKKSLWKNKHFNGLLAWKRIDQLNHILYDTIKDDLLNKSRKFYGFFDLIDVSASRGNWSTDGVHMVAPWYESITSYFWEIFCNSVELDQF